MKRWMRLAARLYPRAWRERYGAEFDALLEDSPLQLRDFADILRGAIAVHISIWTSHRKAVSLFALAGAALALAIAFAIPTRYASDGTILIENPDEGKIERALLETLGRDHLIAVIKQEGLYRRELQRYPIEDLAEDMGKHLRVEHRGQTVRVRFEYPTRRDARSVVQRLLWDVESRANGDLLSARTLASPLTPETPIYPPRLLMLLIGATVGAATGLVFVQYQRRRRVLSLALSPETLRFAQAQASKSGLATAEEYLRHLVLAEQRRKTECEE